MPSPAAARVRGAPRAALVAACMPEREREPEDADPTP